MSEWVSEWRKYSGGLQKSLETPKRTYVYHVYVPKPRSDYYPYVISTSEYEQCISPCLALNVRWWVGASQWNGGRTRAGVKERLQGSRACFQPSGGVSGSRALLWHHLHRRRKTTTTHHAALHPLSESFPRVHALIEAKKNNNKNWEIKKPVIQLSLRLQK